MKNGLDKKLLNLGMKKQKKLIQSSIEAFTEHLRLVLVLELLQEFLVHISLKKVILKQLDTRFAQVYL